MCKADIITKAKKAKRKPSTTKKKSQEQLLYWQKTQHKTLFSYFSFQIKKARITRKKEKFPSKNTPKYLLSGLKTFWSRLISNSVKSITDFYTSLLLGILTSKVKTTTVAEKK